MKARTAKNIERLADWGTPILDRRLRYTMIMPDGKHSERVEYCIGCHLARERYDHLYFPPKKFRIKP